MNMKMSVQYFQTEEQDALEMKLVAIRTPLNHPSDELPFNFKNSMFQK